MARHNSATPGLRWVAFGLVVAAMAAVFPVPASAQFFEDRYPWQPERRLPPPPPNGYYSFPFFNGERPSRPPRPYIRPQQPVESTKAPPPKKLDKTPTNTVVVIGDSMADWLAYGLEETLSDSPDTGVGRKIRPTSGLVRYEPRNDTLEWPQVIKEALATEKPSAIVVMLGLNDRLPLRDRAPSGKAAPSAAEEPARQDGETPDGEAQRAAPNGSYEFHTDKWAELYSKRIDEMIAALKTKGVPVLWVGLPAIRGTHSTSDMTYLDELFRERAEKAGIVYVDIWDGFVDEDGRYTMQGPDFEGQTRRLRTSDGVHFTKAGAVKMAHYVEHELDRVMSNHIAPVALPAPEEQSPAKGNGPGPRPVAGPVVPLTAAAAGNEQGTLLGAGGRSAPAAPDPVAASVLSRGDPVAAQSGRADDFSWPRPDANASGKDSEPEPVALTPGIPAKKGATKNKATPDVPTAHTRRAPNAGLDGADTSTR